MKEMQFTAMVLTLVMAMILMTMLPAEVKGDRVANRSRWWMAGGLLLLWAQFLLQFLSGLREAGVVQAVMLNLIFFVPCSVLLSLSVLNLQLQGRIKRKDYVVGWGVTCCVSGAFLILAVLTESHTLAVGMESMLRLEIAACIVYAAMQVYYGLRIGSQLQCMEAVLADYYDQVQPALLRWMKVSIGILLLMALTVPGAIFSSGKPLALYGILFIIAIVYLWFSLVRYIISAESRRMAVAEKSEGSNHAPGSAALLREEPVTVIRAEAVEMSKGMEQWMARKGYLQHGLTKPVAASEMQMSESQLGAWIKASGYGSFTQWMTALRLDEAIRQLEEHQSYNIGTIADQCGIDRSHFYRLFRERTGMTPVQYQKQHGGDIP